MKEELLNKIINSKKFFYCKIKNEEEIKDLLPNLENINNSVKIVDHFGEFFMSFKEIINELNKIKKEALFKNGYLTFKIQEDGCVAIVKKDRTNFLSTSYLFFKDFKEKIEETIQLNFEF